MRRSNRNGLRLAADLLVAAAVLMMPTVVHAAWTNIHPGVDYSQWTNATPQRVSAVRVDLCAAGVELRATKSDERRQTPSSFGSQVGAEVAVNGDFFSYNNYDTVGLAIGNGQAWPGSSDGGTHGFVAFGQGRVLLSNPPDVVGDTSWMHDAVGGNIMVLLNGQVTNDTGNFCTTRHPRTVAGLSQDGRTLYLAVVDGRSTSSVGMRCDELGTLMKNLGAWTALNLDGGGSSAMWIRGSGVVNQPSDGSQRVVANHLAVLADGSGLPESCNDLDAEFEANFLGLDDFYNDGSSAGVPDVLIGDRFQAEILFQDSSATVFRNVEADYWFQSPYLGARDYTIYTDHPAYDRSSWTVNDSDSAPENPPKDGMGDSGTLTLYAFSPQETKRVLIEMEAERYSIGKVDHPDIRGWIHHIDDIYGEQTSWNQQPTNANHLGDLMQDFAQLDVLSPYEWQFDGGEGQLEGWKACASGDDGPSSSTAEPGAMMLDDGGNCARSPAWTAVDADTYDQMVIRMNGGTSGAPLAVSWRRDGEALGDSARSATFEVRAEAGMTSYVVPLAEIAHWSGEVVGLELIAGFGDLGGKLAIDAIFFQDSQTQRTSSADESFVDEPAVDLVGSDPNTTDDAGSGDPLDVGGDLGDGGSDEAGLDAGTASEAGSTGDGNLTGRSGCACGSASTAPSGDAGPLFVLMLLVVSLRLRRRKELH